MDRVILLSDARFHDANIKLVKEILLNNCFPIQIINKQINRIKQIRNNNNTQNITCNKERGIDPKQCITVPYIKGLNESVDRTLNV